MNRRRRSTRKWRRRGQRAQVAPIATILGLLLVVTFIANYLTTTLPNQMSVNDLDHVIEVENQLGRFQALLEAVSQADAIGAQVTQPVTLGSSAAPPFAGPDSGTIARPANGSGYSLGYSLSGPVNNDPPTGGTAGTGYVPSACTQASTSISCPSPGPYHVYWNYSKVGSTGYSVTTATGSYLVNYTGAAGATITVTTKGANPLDLLVVGNTTTVNLQMSAGPNVDFIEIVGNNDTLSVASVSYTSTIVVYVVGVHDVVTFGTVGSGATLNVVASFFGFLDLFSAANASTTTGNHFSVYFTGYNPTTAAMNCPVNAIATTDKAEGGVSGTATYGVTFNTTTGAKGTATSLWTVSTSTASLYCPFYASATVPYAQVSATGLNVMLANTYIPPGYVAFDSGAVVYAQDGGVPLMIDPPAISLTSVAGSVTAATLWFPIFIGQWATESGIQTTELSARLLSVDSIQLSPSSPFTVENNTNIVFSVTSTFAAGWVSYFNTTAPFENYFSCSGTYAACYGPFQIGGPLGTVTLTIPTGIALNTFSIEIATFGVSFL
ncbi:MAG TPA: hypothetical protein VEL82_03830 [Thermoplasmata archaeon]|nr:hypothetical protein [Thermoplasmata archaeon]